MYSIYLGYVRSEVAVALRVRYSNKFPTMGLLSQGRFSPTIYVLLKSNIYIDFQIFCVQPRRCIRVVSAAD